MKLLQDYAPVLSGLLKDQRLQEGDAYRLMHFVIQQPVEEGVLLYNVLTRAVALLSPEEAQKMDKNPSRFGKGDPEGVCASESANNAIHGFGD